MSAAFDTIHRRKVIQELEGILDEDELVELEPSRDFVTGSPNEIFVIDQEEFEREYEVK